MRLCKSPSSGSTLISCVLQLKWLLLTLTKRSRLSVVTLTEEKCGAIFEGRVWDAKAPLKSHISQVKVTFIFKSSLPQEFSLSIIIVTHNLGFSSGSKEVTRIDKARLRAVCMLSGYQISSDLCHSAVFILSVFQHNYHGGGSSLPFFT